MMKCAIKTSKLTKKYKDKSAVDSLELEIYEGEIFALLGVNGAGKTTAIKMLSCLIKPTDGDAHLMGYSILSDASKIKEIVGVSPQETAVAPNLSVYENLSLMCGIYGMSKERTKKKVAGIIDEFGLSEISKSKPRTLSGGWQRRLSIAMALITEPKILFLDEPTLGLDVIARRELWQVIEKLKGKTTVILTTHYLEEAESLSDRIGIMASGRLRAVGTANELKALSGCDTLENAFVKICTKEV